jgi:hypothetical protein
MSLKMTLDSVAVRAAAGSPRPINDENRTRENRMLVNMRIEVVNI